MEEIKDEEMYEKELNFLKEELRKVDTLIKALGYDKWLDKQWKLWEIREKIKAEIDGLKKPHQAGENKHKGEGTVFHSGMK